jgi:hypothetical protein
MWKIYNEQWIMDKEPWAMEDAGATGPFHRPAKIHGQAGPLSIVNYPF